MRRNSNFCGKSVSLYVSRFKFLLFLCVAHFHQHRHHGKEQLAEEKNIPQYLRSHWQKETGFAFPSGHTMFAASWALLAVGLLWPRRRTLTIAILLVWATGVMGSRLLLGMHWPRDLVVATLISWALVAVATWLAQRICGPLTPPAEENREIAQREQES